MLPLVLNRPSGRACRVLCLGAHCDDIEIGCGGALLSMFEASTNYEVCWVVFSSNNERQVEARKSAEAYLRSIAQHTIIIESFPDGFFPYRGEEIKKRFESIRREFEPDVIFTHHGDDSHQDHRKVHELTWNTFRDHVVLQYEIPKYEGDLGRPNLYIPVSESNRQRKVALLMEHYQTQQNKHWFSEDTFNAVLRLRGIESRSPSGYAEGFHCPKLTLQPAS